MIELKEVFFDIEAKNFKDMIHKVADSLREGGYVNNDFEKNILEREEKYPTGLHFETIDVGIPHTDPEFVKKSAVIGIKLKNPIKVIHMATTDNELMVKNFFMLLIDNGKLQMGLLTELMEMFNDKELTNKIKNSKTKSELASIFAT